MYKFIPAIELNRQFFLQVVQPLLTAAFPSLQYGAALIGPCSEVLGYDTEMSMDHDWGLHFFIFLREEDKEKCQAVASMLSYKLPHTFNEFPVSIPVQSPKPQLRVLEHPLDGPITHQVTVTTLHKFLLAHLGYDIAQPLRPVDWLTVPSHVLLEVVSGEVYHDDTGELRELRRTLGWYPRDVWLYLLAAGWQRIGQEEHLMPRAGFVGDELGSAVIGSRLVRDVMNLCFLMEKRYAPYAKWFGTAFCQLKCRKELTSLLLHAQHARTYGERQQALANAYEVLARMLNSLDIVPQLPATTSSFHDRPFRVVHGEKFALALKEQITDPVVRRLAANSLIGSVSQWSDNTDMERVAKERLRELYE